LVLHAENDRVRLERTFVLLRKKFKLISITNLEDYYYKKKSLKNACHITVDDGDKSFYEIIYPILKKYDIPATLFVSPKICSHSENFWFQEVRGWNKDDFRELFAGYYNINICHLRKYRPGKILTSSRIEEIWSIIRKFKEQYDIPVLHPQNISVDQLTEIDKDGLVSIGAHTLDHPILANESDDRSEREITGSIRELESILNHEVKYFAYPRGIPGLDFSRREMEYLRQNDIRLAFSSEPKIFNQDDNPLCIPRYSLTSGNEYYVRLKLLLGRYWQTMRRNNSASYMQFRSEMKFNIKV
jgi:peptidoglycan/xylan/chitin deacetylase (PgdA/CDA1 family)